MKKINSELLRLLCQTVYELIFGLDHSMGIGQGASKSARGPQQRNRRSKVANWRFIAADAQVKLHHLCPVIRDAHFTGNRHNRLLRSGRDTGHCGRRS